MEIKELQSAKKILFIALSIDIAVTATNLVATFWQIAVLKDVQSGIRIADHSLLGIFGFWDSFALSMIFTVIAVGIGLIRWLSTCYRFAKEVLLATGFKQEGWVAAGWIIPFINLFKPYQVVNEIYKAGSLTYKSSDDWKKENASVLLLSWWAFWAVTHFFMWLIGKVLIKKSLNGEFTLDQLIEVYGLQLWSCAISIVVAGLWFVVANHLTLRLIARAAGKTAPQFSTTGVQLPIVPFWKRTKRVVGVLFIAGVLAAIAIPTYKDFISPNRLDKLEVAPTKWEDLSATPPIAIGERDKNQATPIGSSSPTQNIEATSGPFFVPLGERITVSLQREVDDQYLQAGITLKVTDLQFAQRITANLPLIRSQMINLLSSKKPSELHSTQGKRKLMSEIVTETERVIGTGGVSDVLFTSFIIQ